MLANASRDAARTQGDGRLSLSLSLADRPSRRLPTTVPHYVRERTNSLV